MVSKTWDAFGDLSESSVQSVKEEFDALRSKEAGWYLVVGYLQTPHTFNTAVVYAENRSHAKLQLTTQYPNTPYTAIFVTRQEL